ncbi:platelet glycoprotein Ib beta chain-like isoform X2 [Acropora millepora]|uniref:platelet glycoprotein Ib beta chain-like isoform X2 n=1 Tax=Acropora millepora TaxID=45264 RepID=UPI001CF2F79D|nr:platelet glycoprotein Ib beta chain-like isoform X2 [Acropora millepora]
MIRFWLCAVTLLSMCNLSKSDVCSSLCDCLGGVVNCRRKGLNTTVLLNSSFPTTTRKMVLSHNEIRQLPEKIFSGLTSLQRLVNAFRKHRG